MTTTITLPSKETPRNASETARLIASQALEEIEALAKAALNAMHTSQGHDPEILAQLLRRIVYRTGGRVERRLRRIPARRRG